MLPSIDLLCMLPLVPFFPRSILPQPTPFNVHFRFLLQPFNLLAFFSVVPFWVRRLFTSLNQNSSIAFISRIIRTINIVRLKKVTAASRSTRVLVRTISAAWSTLALLLFIVILSTITFGTLIYLCERGELRLDPSAVTANSGDANATTAEQSEYIYMRPNLIGDGWEPSPFVSIPVSLWFIVSTITATGYGDLVPTTPLGWIVSTGAMLAGTILISTTVVVFGKMYRHEYVEELKKEEFVKKRRVKIKKKQEEKERKKKEKEKAKLDEELAKRDAEDASNLAESLGLTLAIPSPPNNSTASNANQPGPLPSPSRRGRSMSMAGGGPPIPNLNSNSLGPVPMLDLSGASNGEQGPGLHRRRSTLLLSAGSSLVSGAGVGTAGSALGTSAAELNREGSGDSNKILTLTDIPVPLGYEEYPTPELCSCPCMCGKRTCNKSANASSAAACGEDTNNTNDPPNTARLRRARSLSVTTAPPPPPLGAGEHDLALPSPSAEGAAWNSTNPAQQTVEHRRRASTMLGGERRPSMSVLGNGHGMHERRLSLMPGGGEVPIGHQRRPSLMPPSSTSLIDDTNTTNVSLSSPSQAQPDPFLSDHERALQDGIQSLEALVQQFAALLMERGVATSDTIKKVIEEATTATNKKKQKGVVAVLKKRRSTISGTQATTIPMPTLPTK